VSYDPTTDAGKVRLLISDTDVSNEVFTDTEISTFLTLEGDSVYLAAAQALDTLASNEVLVQKRIKMLDLSTDGPAESRELRARASSLRDQHDDVTDFDIAEMVVDDFSARERLAKQALRGEL